MSVCGERGRVSRLPWRSVGRFLATDYTDENNLALLAAATPPDVRYRLKNQEPILKFDSIHSGYAAGCEAGLCPAVSAPNQNWGYAPGLGFALNACFASSE